MNSVAITAFAAAIISASPVGQQAAAVEPETTRYIFFDFGRPVLTRDAEATLEEVVSVAREKPQLRIDVAGFSDAAGPARANTEVSRSRGEAVRAYLQSQGISADRIRVSAHGERGLLVPTSDGVREAQNRRVEVRLIR